MEREGERESFLRLLEALLLHDDDDDDDDAFYLEAALMSVRAYRAWNHDTV